MIVVAEENYINLTGSDRSITLPFNFCIIRIIRSQTVAFQLFHIFWNHLGNKKCLLRT